MIWIKYGFLSGLIVASLLAVAILRLHAQTDTTPLDRDQVRTAAQGIDQATIDYNTLANALYAKLQDSPEAKKKKALEDSANAMVKVLQQKCEKAGRVLSLDVKDAPKYLHCVDKPKDQKK